MTTANNQKAHKVIAQVGANHSPHEELSDSDLEAIAGGGNQVVGSVLTGSGTPLPGGKVLEISTRTATVVSTVDLPRVGNVVGRAATLPYKTVGISYGIRDAHPAPQNTIGY